MENGIELSNGLEILVRLRTRKFLKISSFGNSYLDLNINIEKIRIFWLKNFAGKLNFWFLEKGFGKYIFITWFCLSS